jgi:hypothetical protein
MDPAPEDVAVRPIIVADEIGWNRVSREGLGHLPGQPLCLGVCRDTDPTDLSSADAEHDEREERLKGQGAHASLSNQTLWLSTLAPWRRFPD